MATGQRKFLLVAVDYFFKWIEAEPLAKITEEIVKKFIWQHIICRFGIPRRLISDNGRQFSGQHLKEWCEWYGIQQAFTSVAYLQSNGQAEVTNREILRVLRAQLDHEGGCWVDELNEVLWVLRMTPKDGPGATPFHLVGDLVWKKVKTVGDVSKLGAPWVGSFKIVEKLRSGAYYLEDEDGRKLK
ncbi:uncharacterized protein K02A2.6-like [Zingiber officinale]|uniref:uncharacterized protein K02A2.6-like n=1 Tax=Zingiber officinale TaxID=94328 RepID=UPI001C4CAA28|nr:uncharacterized protein K02A2.6-like [Zingiber officinale]